MKRARGKALSTHYLLMGSVVVGECFPDRDGKAFLLHLKKGTSLNWRDTKKLRLLPAWVIHSPSSLAVESFV
jgi:hypothetical protein